MSISRDGDRTERRVAPIGLRPAVHWGNAPVRPATEAGGKLDPTARVTMVDGVIRWVTAKFFRSIALRIGSSVLRKNARQNNERMRKLLNALTTSDCEGLINSGTSA